MGNQGTILAPGDAFGDKYTIESVLGHGGMGIVYLATHRRLGQRVAIKTLQPEMLSRPELVARFEREARASAQLKSQHVVRVLDVSELPNGLPFMVMEYLEGHDLETELERRGPLPVGEAVGWLVQACTAMREAHDRGIVHRDLKPANLFLAEVDRERTLKVLDFGISKYEEPEAVAMTSTQATMGTPLYMSPEQLRSTKLVDRRTDIWSLGIILYEMLAGRPPFQGSAASIGAAIVSDDIAPLRTLRADIPEELERVIMRALARRREDRYPDVAALAAALAPFSDVRVSMPSLPLIPSQPQFVARTGASMRAPTMAVEGSPEQPRTPTDLGWGSESSQGRARRKIVGITAIATGLIAVISVVGVVVAWQMRSPQTTSTASAATGVTAAPTAPKLADPTAAAPLVPSTAPLPSASAAPPPTASGIAHAPRAAPTPRTQTTSPTPPRSRGTATPARADTTNPNRL